MSEIWNLSTLCRCCHADGHFKSLNLSYQAKNHVEIYESMLRETLGIFITTQPGPLEASYTICDSCISKLRDATQFRNQVLMCEQKFKLYCKNDFLEIDEKLILDVKKEYRRNPEMVNVEINASENKSNFEEIPKNIRCRQKLTKNKEQSKRRINLDRSFIIQMDTDTGSQFSCKDCGGLYQTEKDIKKHINKAHATSFECEYCPKQLKSIHNLKNHLKLHTGKLLICNFCSKKFASKNALKDHLNSHTKEKMYKCHLCDKDYMYKQTLNIHLKVHAGTNKKILCDLCGWSFNDQSNLDAHTRTVHEKLRPYNCKICKKSYSNKRHLRDHLKVHSGDEKLYKCDICDKRLSSPKTMQIHRLKHDNKFMCGFCSKIFDDSGSKIEHVKVVHNKVLPWMPCPICGKVFSGKFSLNRHIDEHKGIKKFPCHVCGLKFTQKATLNRHMFRKHSPDADIDIAKTKCEICKRSFKNIVAHMDSHNNRLKACDLCGKTYPDTRALNRHKSFKHFGKSFDCGICEKKYLRKSTLNTHRMKVHNIKIENGCEEGI